METQPSPPFGERVARDGAVISRRGPGEGSSQQERSVFSWQSCRRHKKQRRRHPRDDAGQHLINTVVPSFWDRPQWLDQWQDLRPFACQSVDFSTGENSTLFESHTGEHFRAGHAQSPVIVENQTLKRRTLPAIIGAEARFWVSASVYASTPFGVASYS